MVSTESMSTAYAHSANEAGERHRLVDHLRGTAERAAAFAAPVSLDAVAYRLGMWHDLGKFHPDWQRYLVESEVNPGRRGHGPDHKAAGTVVAARTLGPLALAVHGHHGGMTSPAQLNAWLSDKSSDQRTHQALVLAMEALPELESLAAVPGLPKQFANPHDGELSTRVLYSCLVDADFLDTESHFDSGRTMARGGDVPLPDLWTRFEEYHRKVSATAPSTTVNAVRREVYESCVEAASIDPGVFRLRVPTGGGKTLSGMAFALRHALKHGMSRVIVAVPFISITEQTAQVYREIFDRPREPPVVLEHHSGVRTADPEWDEYDRATEWHRLASENWDASIVVTTTVQLFESLFARTPSACRKVHRLTNAVVLLDEAQALPSRLLEPILDGLRFLAEHGRTSVVLSTATQPAFDAIPTFSRLPAVELVPEAQKHFALLSRVEYRIEEQSTSWVDVASRVGNDHAGLVVVNTKRDALALLDALGDPDALHLSTLLCGAHRRNVLAEITTRLQNGAPCRVVATQVVEAGVDLDFPAVYRAMGPLDSIIQAAGRCNREGRLEKGVVTVFRPAEGGLPPGAYRTGTAITESLLGTDPDAIGNPQIAEEYFRRLYSHVDTDQEQIQRLRSRFEYEEVARRFRMIEDDTIPVVVTTYGSSRERSTVRSALDSLRERRGNPRELMRRLQPYVVSLRRHQADRLMADGLVTAVTEGLAEWHGRYDPVRGLIAADPELVI